MSSTRRLELPTDLLTELDELGEVLGLGYATSAEAVKDAVRRRIEELRAAIVNRKHLKSVTVKAEAE